MFETVDDAWSNSQGQINEPYFTNYSSKVTLVTIKFPTTTPNLIFEDFFLAIKTAKLQFVIEYLNILVNPNHDSVKANFC